MRGTDVFSEQLFTVKKLDDFIPSSHPLRPIRERVNVALVRLNGLFEKMYEPGWKGGRPSIAPEKLARAMLLQVFYSIRSERQPRGLAKVDQVFVLNMAAYNLVRMRTLGKLRLAAAQMG